MNTYDLDCFVAAQDGVYADLIDELSAGHKRSLDVVHLPADRRAGLSMMAQRYAIG